MAYRLHEINKHAISNPEQFALDCELLFSKRVSETAEKISRHVQESPIVLLSGPSGSGKTTTANRICDQLSKHGLRAKTISLDNYFVTLDLKTAPRTPEGDVDYESPYCLDLKLLDEHFSALERFEEIEIPYFSFKDQARLPERASPFKLGPDEVVIFEGIHALNDMLTQGHPSSFKLYISARSNIEEDGKVVFKGTWIRLMRRVVRDELFRGTDALMTLGMWANVRKGEKKNISPYKNKADVLFDASMPYEVPVLKQYAIKTFSSVPNGAERFEELRLIPPALEAFESMDSAVIPKESILREFIGGGIYEY